MPLIYASSAATYEDGKVDLFKPSPQGICDYQLHNFIRIEDVARACLFFMENVRGGSAHTM